MPAPSGVRMGQRVGQTVQVGRGWKGHYYLSRCPYYLSRAHYYLSRAHYYLSRLEQLEQLEPLEQAFAQLWGCSTLDIRFSSCSVWVFSCSVRWLSYSSGSKGSGPWAPSLPESKDIPIQVIRESQGRYEEH